jgi:hypothetical protein
MPRLRLVDLLKRRKMTLRQLLGEFGITTYEGLLARCERMGVLPPNDEEFKVAHPDPPVNSPQEGVIVLEPLPVIDDMTGRKIDPEAPVVPEVKVITDITPSEDFMLQPIEVNDQSSVGQDTDVLPTEGTQKKHRKKKE